MSRLNPLTVWRRFLALPNESRFKTIAVAFLVSLFCAGLVTGATVILRPIQTANRAAEQALRLEALLASIPGIDAIMEAAGGGTLSTTVIDLERGATARGVTPQTLEAALADPAGWTVLAPEDDVAGLGARPDYAQVYFLRQGERLALLIVPLVGTGYNGPIRAMLALRGDMNTIAGIAITDQAETPGLGARITEPLWQAQFAGKQLADEAGTLQFTVARGPAGTDFEVDGITGATRTGNAVTRLVRFWAGPLGYGPFFDAVRAGEF